VLLTVGSKIVYPSQGPCRIISMVERLIDQQPRTFYQLRALNGGGCDLFIPLEKVETIGIRLLLELSEIPRLLDHLTQPVIVVDNFRQRRVYILELFASGLAFDLAEIVGSLTELNNTRSLAFGEHKTLERSKQLLTLEIAEVMGTTREAAEERVEAALATRIRKALAGSTTGRRIANSRNPIRYQAASG